MDTSAIQAMMQMMVVMMGMSMVRMPMNTMAQRSTTPGDYKGKLIEELKKALPDEAEADVMYRRMATYAREIGRQDMEEALEDIASDERRHYTVLGAMLSYLDPSWRGRIRE